MQGDQGDIELPDEQELCKAAERVLDLGHRKGLTVTLATAESCTGGLVDRCAHGRCLARPLS
jgi:hypothetical protein